MKIEFDCNELSLDEYFYLLSAEDKEKILKIRIGDYYWTPNGLIGATQVKAIHYAYPNEDWHQISVERFPEPQAYHWSIDARALYRTKGEALSKVREILLKKIKETDTELKKYKKYKKYLKNVEKELKE